MYEIIMYFYLFLTHEIMFKHEPINLFKHFIYHQVHVIVMLLSHVQKYYQFNSINSKDITDSHFENARPTKLIFCRLIGSEQTA